MLITSTRDIILLPDGLNNDMSVELRCGCVHISQLIPTTIGHMPDWGQLATA